MFTERHAGSFALRKYGFYALIAFYGFAGINHFVMAEFYLPLIPDYFPAKSVLNIVAGLAEIGLAIGLTQSNYRRWSALGIILLLLAFIPSHVHFIQEGSCVSNSLCVPNWIGWIRLLVIHPMLLYWAWIYRNYNLKSPV